MAILKLSIDARESRRGADEATRGYDKVRSSSRRATEQVDRFDRSLDRAGTRAGTVGRQIRGLFAGFTAIQAVRQAVTTIASFEETLATVRGVTGATQDQFVSLSATARELGATTRFSATEAGEGLLFLARAGFEVEEAQAALPATLNLAIGGAIGLGEAADFASNILSQFGLTAGETTRVVDVLVATANRANTNVSQLAQALTFAGPVAGSLGIEIEDTAAAIGKLGDSGIQASQAGTNLRGILLALTAPTTAAQGAFRELGITFDQVNPATQDLSDVFRVLGEAGERAGDDVARLFNEIFGRRNVGGALILSGVADDFEDLREQLRGADGEAEALAALIDDTLAGSLRSLRSAVEEAFLSLGDEGFAGALRTVVDVATGAIRILVGMEDAVTDNREASQLLADAVQGVAIAFAALAAARIVGFFGTVVTAINTTTTSMAALNTVVANNKFVLLAAAITGLIALFRRYRDETVTIGETTATVGDFIFATFDLIIQRVTLTARIFGEVWRIALDGIRQLVDLVFREAFGVTLDDFFNDLTENWDLALTAVLDTIKFFANSAIGAFKSVGDVIFLLIDRVIDFGRAFTNINTEITSGFGLGEVARALGDAVDPGAFADDFTEVFAENFSTDFVAAFQEIGAEGGQNLVDAANEVFADSSLGADIEALFAVPDFSSLVEGRKELRLAAEASKDGADAATQFTDAFNSLAEGGGLNNLENSLDGVTQNLENSAQGVANSFGDAFNQIALRGSDLAEVLRNLFGDVTSQLFNALVTQQLVGSVGGGGQAGTGLAGFLGGLFGSSTPSANGNGFSGGNIVPFQLGGLLQGPTFFQFGSNRLGVAGEAGDEFVMPAARGPDGRLGVQAVGGGGTTNVSFTQIVQTPDANSFRKSRGQLARDSRDFIGGAGQ